MVRARDAVDRCNHADQKVQPHAVAGLHAGVHCFRSDAGHAHLIRVVLERVVGIVGELAVDADGLQPVQGGVA